MLFIIALVFFIPVFAEYIKTGLVPNFPTLIVCGFCTMAALMAYFSGMILSTIVQKNKQDFEYKLMQTERSFKTEKENGK